jgi:predicted RNA-binding protein with PUA-like domain
MTTARTTRAKPAAKGGHWMVKQEPTTYPWAQFVKDGGTAWTGVRNFQARNNLAAMKRGDHVLYYHSVEGKEVVGIAKVERDAYPDPTAEEGSWKAVDLVPVRPLKKPVSLAAMKAEDALREIALLRQSQLSVMSLTPAAFAYIVAMGGA